MCLLLESKVQLHSQSAAVDARAVEVGQTPHIVETQASENVVDTYTYLHIAVSYTHLTLPTIVPV